MLGSTRARVDARGGLAKPERLRAPPAQRRRVGRRPPVRASSGASRGSCRRSRTRAWASWPACSRVYMLRDARLGRRAGARSSRSPGSICRCREGLAHLDRGAGGRHLAPGRHRRRRAAHRVGRGAPDDPAARRARPRRSWWPRCSSIARWGSRWSPPWRRCMGVASRAACRRAAGRGPGGDSRRGAAWPGRPAPGTVRVGRAPVERAGRKRCWARCSRYVRDPRAPRAIATAAALSVVVAAVQFVVIRGLVFALGARARRREVGLRRHRDGVHRQRHPRPARRLGNGRRGVRLLLRPGRHRVRRRAGGLPPFPTLLVHSRPSSARSFTSLRAVKGEWPPASIPAKALEFTLRGSSP